MDAFVLGRLEVRMEGTAVPLGAPKVRLLCALLLCHANRLVSTDQLIDALWGERPPPTARKNLQVYVSGLRKNLGNRISHQGWGYRLNADSDELDLLRFRDLAAAGREARRRGQADRAVVILGDALRLWRERPLMEFADVPMIDEAVARITELYLTLNEDWAELEIERGRYVEVLGGLDDLAPFLPTRERLVAARMTALAGCGRTSEALAQFEAARRYLAAELGIDPSPVLSGLYDEILRGSGPTRPEMGSAASTVRRTNQLPRDLGDFVGRTAHTREILNARDQVTLITGGPGVGKTVLAVHAAHMISPNYPDGALMVSLRDNAGRPRDETTVQREILESMDVGVAEVRERSTVATVWRSWLANRRVLILLDDAPAEASVRPWLPGAPGSRVLVTARSRLSGLESVHRIVLPELSEAEAIELLRRLAGTDRVLNDRVRVLAILDLAGRLPLALRLLGERLAAHPQLSPTDLADRLRDTDDFLGEFTAGDRSLRSRFDDCYGDPSWPGRDALRALAALPQPTFSQAELVSALGGDRVGGIIDALIEANVLSGQEGEVVAHARGYAISPLTHRYARENLPASWSGHTVR